MRRLAKFLRRYWGSMSGRFFVLLVVGVALSATLALVMADIKQQRDLERARLERAATSVAELVSSPDVSQRPEDMRLFGMRMGLRTAPASVAAGAPDPEYTALLVTRLGAARAPTATRVAAENCFPRPSEFRTGPGPGGPQGLQGPQGPYFRTFERRAPGEGPGFRAGPGEPGRGPQMGPVFVDGREMRADGRRPMAAQPVCWLVSLTLDGSETLRLLQLGPPVLSAYSRLTTLPYVSPTFLAVLVASAVLLAFLVSGMAAAPLDQMAKAAEALGDNLERAPLNVRGPHEVRAAARAFNVMQARLRATMRERSQMLAAITHDLQTPLTRMRLRVESVENPELRERLIADIGAMHSLIQEGLDLVRTSEAIEQSAPLDLDSLVESLIEDAAEMGHAARFLGGCGCDIEIKPQALRRALQNLIDNAIRHGGSVEARCAIETREIAITIRDHGPGIPEDQLETVFEAFARLDHSRSRDTGGVGLGLTIARTLTERAGGRLTLHNHPEGGLEARLALPLSVILTTQPAQEQSS